MGTQPQGCQKGNRILTSNLTKWVVFTLFMSPLNDSIVFMPLMLIQVAIKGSQAPMKVINPHQLRRKTAELLKINQVKDHVCGNIIATKFCLLAMFFNSILYRAANKHFYLLLLVVLSIYHSAWSLPNDYSAKKSSSRFSNSSKSLTGNASTNLRQRRFSAHNEWDGRLYRVCEDDYGMYHVESRHDNHREDRIWAWQCRRVFQNRPQTCSWTSYVNEFDQPILFMCGRNEYLRGVESYHSNPHEDRRWRFYCCHSNGYVTKSCEISGYVNDWDHPMHFQARQGQIITGAFSYHNNGRE